MCYSTHVTQRPEKIFFAGPLEEVFWSLRIDYGYPIKYKESSLEDQDLPKEGTKRDWRTLVKWCHGSTSLGELNPRLTWPCAYVELVLGSRASMAPAGMLRCQR